MQKLLCCCCLILSLCMITQADVSKASQTKSSSSVKGKEATTASLSEKFKAQLEERSLNTPTTGVPWEGFQSYLESKPAQPTKADGSPLDTRVILGFTPEQRESLQTELAQLYAEAVDLKDAGLPNEAVWNRIQQIQEELGHGSVRDRDGLDEGGEDCAHAAVITSLPYCDTGSTHGHDRTYLPPADCEWGGRGRDVVYTYTPQVTQVVSVSLCGSSYDTYLHVYANACPGDPNAVLVCCDDDTDCNPNNPFVSCCPEIALVGGQTYYIIVDGWGLLDNGGYELNISEDFNVCGVCPEESCDNDLTIGAPGFVTGTTCNAGNDCDLRPSQDIIVYVEIPHDGLWTFSLCGSSFDTYMHIGTECCSDDVCSNDDTYRDGCFWQSECPCLELATGEYWVTIEAFAPDQCGDFVLTVEECEPCDVECPDIAVLEQELPCSDPNFVPINNGCVPGAPPMVEDIECNTVLCGTLGRWGSGQFEVDTDWFRVQLDGTDSLSVCVVAEAAGLFGIFAAGCDGGPIEIADFGPCDTTYIGACLPAGEYWIGIVDGEAVCDVEYVLRVTCEPCGCVECPPNAQISQELPCNSPNFVPINDGCDVPPGVPPLFEDASCNSTICGTSGGWLDDLGNLHSDVDWFRIQLDGTHDSLLVCGLAEGPFAMAVARPGPNGGCVGSEFIWSTNLREPCVPICFRRCLPPGEYWIGIIVDGPCGAPYRIDIHCFDCEQPEPCVCEGELIRSGPLFLDIPDNGLTPPCTALGGVEHVISIPPTDATVADVNVAVNITHTWNGDLAISLEHNGVVVHLKTRPPFGLGADCDNIHTTFDDEGNPWIENNCPHIGCFQTFNQGDCPGPDLLSAFDGMPVAGDWILRVADGTGADVGTLDNWGLCIESEEGCIPDPQIAHFHTDFGVPQYQCLYICPDDTTIIRVGPGLGPHQRPIMHCTPGCLNQSVPGGGCYEPNCPPAEFVHGNWRYRPENQSWYNWVVAAPGTAPGCICCVLEGYLAVELSDFDAQAGDGEVTLNWTTESESDNDYFDVLRDGTIMGRVDAMNYASGSDYSWTEYNLTNGREYGYTLVAVDVNGIREEVATTSATPTFSAAAVTEYALHQNYPNPFNPATNIAFDLVESGNVTLKVYNPLGQEIATLVSGSMPAGRHTISFSAGDLPSGIYFYRLVAGDFTANRKMILIK